MMKAHVQIMSFLLLFTLICSCRSTVSGILIQHGTASLRLYEESSGRLMAVKPGVMSIEVISWVNRPQQPSTPPAKTSPRVRPYLDQPAQNQGFSGVALFVDSSKDLHVRLKIRGKTFLLRFDKSKIDKDGRFSYSADTLEQPVRVRGRIHKKQSEFQVNFNLYRGFSRTDRLIGSFASGPMDISLLDEKKESKVMVAEESSPETKAAGFIGPLPLEEKPKAEEKVALLKKEDTANETATAIKELPKATKGSESVIGFIGPLPLKESDRVGVSQISLRSENSDNNEEVISGQSKNIKEAKGVFIGPLPLKEENKTEERIDLLSGGNT